MQFSNRISERSHVGLSLYSNQRLLALPQTITLRTVLQEILLIPSQTVISSQILKLDMTIKTAKTTFSSTGKQIKKKPKLSSNAQSYIPIGNFEDSPINDFFNNRRNDCQKTNKRNKSTPSMSRQKSYSGFIKTLMT